MSDGRAGDQRGLGLFGTLVILAIAAGAGYYVYVGVFRDGQAPSCSEAQQDCMKACRRTSTDQASAAACQGECQRKRDACK
jgi:hypothetical protein